MDKEEPQMEEKILRTVNQAIEKSIVENLTGYNSPLNTFVNEVIENKKGEFIKIIDGEISKIIKSPQFKKSLNQAFNDKLARILISNLGGELEKQVNQLKSNPETRAKITIALSNIINENS
jgi:hypothetical protein